MVVSQNFSSATSLAMLAPISTFMVIPSFSWITSEMSLSPSGPSSTPWRNKHKTHACIYIRPYEAGIWVKDHSAQVADSCFHAAQRAKSNLDEGYADCITLYLALHGVAHSSNKLVRNHKNQNICITGCIHQVRNSQLRKNKG